MVLIYSCSRIAHMNVEISGDTKFSNWRLCDALSFFEVVVDAGGEDGVGDEDGAGGEDGVGDEDDIGDRGSRRDGRSLVVISVTFVTLLNHPLRNYRYLDG